VDGGQPLQGARVNYGQGGQQQDGGQGQQPQPQPGGQQGQQQGGQDDGQQQGQGGQQQDGQQQQGQQQGQGQDDQTPEEKAKQELQQKLQDLLNINPQPQPQQDLSDELQQKLDEAEQKIEELQNKADEALQELPQRVEFFPPDEQPIELTDEHPLMATLLREIKLGHNCLLVGPPGSGKTYAGERCFELLGFRGFPQPAPHDPFDLIGFYGADAKTYVPTQFYHWATCPEKAGFLLDELDASNPQALMPASPAITKPGFAVFPTGVVRIPTHHVVIGTANAWPSGNGIGAYCGANKQDARIVNRFPTRLWWDIDETLERKIVRKHGGCMEALKEALKVRRNLNEAGMEIEWGPRDTVALCRRVASGVTLKEALKISGLAELEADQYQRATARVSFDKFDNAE
jgi:MoxR-like ATPase